MTGSTRPLAMIFALLLAAALAGASLAQQQGQDPQEAAPAEDPPADNATDKPSDNPANNPSNNPSNNNETQAGGAGEGQDAEVAADEPGLEDPELDDQTYGGDDDIFIPTEEVPADEAIPFPTDI